MNRGKYTALTKTALRKYTFNSLTNQLYVNHSSETNSTITSTNLETQQQQPSRLYQLNQEQQLYRKVLEIIPSQREAASYLHRVNLKPKKEFLNLEHQPKFPIALVVLKAPFDKSDFDSIIQTLITLTKLNIKPIVLLDNKNWYHQLDNDGAEGEYNSSEKFKKLKLNMLKDGLALIQMLELKDSGGRLIDSGILFNDGAYSTTKVDLTNIKSAFQSNSIPICLPLALDNNNRSFHLNSYHWLAALSKQFSRYADSKPLIDNAIMDVIKVIVINNKGGLPNLISNPNQFINLQEDLETLTALANSSKEDEKVKDWKLDLDLCYSSLAYLPATTSAIVVKAKKVSRIIDNLITDKPIKSKFNNAPYNDVNYQSEFSIMRYGLKVTTHNSLDTLDLVKLKTLLEKSFGRKLKGAEFEKQLNMDLNHVIVAGDYQGCAIVTNQQFQNTNIPSDQLDHFLYLDKFAVDPQFQGIGVADVLWQNLNNNCKTLVWRSRSNNKVNNWYFDRSDGSLNLNVENVNELKKGWRLFWYGGFDIKSLVQVSKKINGIQPSFV